MQLCIHMQSCIQMFELLKQHSHTHTHTHTAHLEPVYAKGGTKSHILLTHFFSHCLRGSIEVRLGRVSLPLPNCRLFIK